jgi:hypothetical protein
MESALRFQCSMPLILSKIELVIINWVLKDWVIIGVLLFHGVLCLYVAPSPRES